MIKRRNFITNLITIPAITITPTKLSKEKLYKWNQIMKIVEDEKLQYITQEGIGKKTNKKQRYIITMDLNKRKFEWKNSKVHMTIDAKFKMYSQIPGTKYFKEEEIENV